MIHRSDRKAASGLDYEVRAATEVRVKRAAGGAVTIEGYAAKFNTRSVDLGGFVETIAPGAFTETLAKNPDILALFNHDDNYALGRTKSGTLKLSEDATGLAFECTLPDTTIGRDLPVLLERGDIEGCSFGFCVEEDSVDPPEDGKVPLRTLKRVGLVEVTLGTAWPAYPDTTIALRSVNAALAAGKAASVSRRAQARRWLDLEDLEDD